MFTKSDALQIATTAHSGQTDKSGGTYISYLESIANQLEANGESEQVVITALKTLWRRHWIYSASFLN